MTNSNQNPEQVETEARGFALYVGVDETTAAAAGAAAVTPEKINQMVEGLAARWGWDKNTVIAGIKRAGGNIRRVGRPTRLPVAPGDLLAPNEHGMTRRQLAALCEAPIGTIDGALSRARRARPLL